MKYLNLCVFLLGFSAAFASAQQGSSLPAGLGLVVRASQTAQERIEAPGGVFVSSVEPGSFAASIGLYKGALILEINRQPVPTLADYRTVLSQLKPGDDVVFVLRGSNSSKGKTLLGGRWLGAGAIAAQSGGSEPLPLPETASSSPRPSTAASELEAQADASLGGNSAAAPPATSSDLEAQAIANLGGDTTTGPPATGAALEAQALQSMQTNEVASQQQEAQRQAAEQQEREQESIAAANQQASEAQSSSSRAGGFVNALISTLGVVNEGLSAQIASQDERNAELQARMNAQVAANNARRAQQAEEQQQAARERQQAQQQRSAFAGNSGICQSARSDGALMGAGCFDGSAGSTSSTVSANGRSTNTRVVANTSPSNSDFTYVPTPNPNQNPGGVPSGVSTGTAPPPNCVYLGWEPGLSCLPLTSWQQIQLAPEQIMPSDTRPTRRVQVYYIVNSDIPVGPGVHWCPRSGHISTGYYNTSGVFQAETDDCKVGYHVRVTWPALGTITASVCPASGCIMVQTGDVSVGQKRSPGQPVPGASGNGYDSGSPNGSTSGGGSSLGGGGGGLAAHGPIDPNLNSCIGYAYNKGNFLVFTNNCSVAASVAWYASQAIYGRVVLDPGGSDNTYNAYRNINAAGGFSLYACPSGDYPRKSDGGRADTGINNSFACTRN